MEFSHLLLGFLEHLNGLVDVGDIGFDGDGAAAHLLDGFADLVGGVAGVGVVDDDVGAAAGELEGHFAANATALGES